MSSSIRRAGHWWNQAPDGTWLRWSQQNSAWEPQEAAPPPPDAPPPPPPAIPVHHDQGQGSAATPGASRQSGEHPGGSAPLADEEAVAAARTPDDVHQDEEPPAPTSQKANAPMFSSTRRSIAPVIENKKVAALAAGVAVLIVFVATYMGATFFFRSAYGNEVAVAGEKEAEPMSNAKQRYIARLDRMCSKSGDLSALENRILAVDSPGEMRGLFARVEDRYKRQMARVHSIEKPKQDRKLLERILSLQRKALPFLDRILAAFEARDETSVQTLAAEAYAKAAKSRRLMEEYGFQVCGRA